MSYLYRNHRTCPSCNTWEEHTDHLMELILADLTALNAVVDTAVAALADLAAKVAAGDSTAQASIDAITAKLSAAVQANDPSVPSAPVVGAL